MHDAAWNLILWSPWWAALFGDASALRGRERNIAGGTSPACPSGSATLPGRRPVSRRPWSPTSERRPPGTRPTPTCAP
ncbi:hypothetical protein OHS70_01935 [Streptomyces sp. NBC_00390]|uniref:hypothetical protein n=1 Tax=Streptomyces sp. NBC_00390 TaxID=2975736 RepID=UPI002E2153A0